MIVQEEITVTPSLVKRLLLVIAGLWRGLLWLGFLAIGLVASMVGLQIPIVALVLALLLILGGICRSTLPERGRPIAPIACGGVVLLLGLAAASLTWTPDLEAAQHQLIQFSYVLLPLALGLGVVAKLPARQTKALQWAMIFGVVIGLAILVFEVREGKLIHTWLADLGPGESLSINEFNRALLGMAILTMPAVGLLLARGQDNLAIVIPVAYGALLLQTESQTALLGVIAGAITYVLVVRWPKLTFILVAAAFVILSLGALPLAFGLHAMGLNDADWLMLSARHRIEVWHFAAQKILAAPWLGHGLEASQASFPRASDISTFLSPDLSMVHRHPHNLFLQFWYEFGAAGAVLLSAIGAGMLWRLWQMPKRARDAGLATFGACAAMLAVSAFSIWHTWLLCALAMALYGVALLSGTTTATMILPPGRGATAGLDHDPMTDPALTENGKTNV